ncbi:DUF4244 domain-containing protein [Scrofimicrobium canadense]|nr:DUF4244 domain-containing protein [Scrofimicrobium canadense]
MRKLQKAALCGQLWFTHTPSGEDSEEGSTTVEYAISAIAAARCK